MAVSEEVLVKILADIADLKKKLDDAQKATKSSSKQMGDSFNKLQKQIKQVVGAIAGLVVIRKTSEWFGESIQQAAEEEEAMKRLGTALGNVGVSFKEESGRIGEFLKSMQATTTYGDTEMAVALQNLVLYTGDLDAAMKGSKVAADLAASGMFDLDTASKNVGMAMTGNVEMLGRYIPEFRNLDAVLGENATASEKAEYAMKILNEKFGGTAEGQLQTYGGQVKQLQNYWSDMREEIGRKLIPILIELLPHFKEVIEHVIYFLEQIQTREGVLGRFVSLLDMLGRYMDDITGKTKAETIATDLRIQKERALADMLERQGIPVKASLIQEMAKYIDLGKKGIDLAEEYRKVEEKSNETGLEHIKARKAETDAQKALSQEKKKFRHLTEAEIKTLDKAVDKRIEAMIRQEKVEEITRQWSEKAIKQEKERLEEFMDKAMQADEAWQNFIARAVYASQMLGSIVDAVSDEIARSLIEGTASWGEFFSNMTKQILMQLTALAIKVAIVRGLLAMGGLPGALAGFLERPLGLQRGGVVKRPILMGEAGEEAVVPLTAFWRKMESLMAERGRPAETMITLKLEGLVSLTDRGAQDRMYRIGVRPAERRFARATLTT